MAMSKFHTFCIQGAAMLFASSMLACGASASANAQDITAACQPENRPAVPEQNPEYHSRHIACDGTMVIEVNTVYDDRIVQERYRGDGKTVKWRMIRYDETT